MPTHVFKLNSFPIDQRLDLEGTERHAGSFFHRLDDDVRLIALSHSFSLRTPLHTLRQREQPLSDLTELCTPLFIAMRAPDGDPQAILRSLPPHARERIRMALRPNAALQAALDELLENDTPEDATELWAALATAFVKRIWPASWLRDQQRFYEALERRHLRMVEYFLVAWTDEHGQPAALQASLQHALGREVQLVDHLPNLMQTVYHEESSYLRPKHPGYPLMTVLLSYDMRGEWDGLVLHRLLALPYDLAIAVDVRTFSHAQAMRMAELSYRTSTVLQYDPTIKDARAERVLSDSDVVMHRLPYESLHAVQIAIQVTGETPKHLNERVAEIMGILGSTMSVNRIPDVQWEALKYWSTTSSRLIDAPYTPKHMLSHGVGCCACMTGYHMATATEGILWGIDSIRHSPIFYDLFRNNQAAHMVVLGKSGYGKTFFFNITTARAAAIEGYRVIGIDAFHNGARVEDRLGAGARCHWIGPETTVNLLDIVFDRRTEGGWRGPQAYFVIGQLALFLGKPATLPGIGETLIAREFEPGEEGVLDRALNDLYADLDPDMPRSTMPILSDLIAQLERIDEPEARSLAELLAMKLFGSRTSRTLTALGRNFNGHSSVDWRFEADVSYYDFSAVSQRWRPFYYADAIGAINRFMRDPYRDLSRRTLLLIDEFHYVAKVQAVAQLAAEICKVARKYKVGLMVADQNPITFLGSETGQFIFENAVAKMVFHLDDSPARQLAEAVGDMHEGHIHFLSHATVGQALGIFGNDIFLLTVESSPRELRSFIGS